MSESETIISVGVVVPTLGSRSSLTASINSILSLGFRPYLLVPESRLGDIPDKVRRESTVILDKGRGLTTELHQALLKLADDHQLIGWLGDDDQLIEKGMRQLVRLYSQDQKIGLLYGQVGYVDKNLKTIGWNRFGKLAKTPLKRVLNFYSQPGSLFSGKAYIDSGGLNTNYLYAFDLDLFLKISKVAVVKYVSYPVALYTWHSDTLTSTNMWASAKETASIRKNTYGGLAVLLWPFAELASVSVLFVARKFWRIKHRYSAKNT